jgi:hypothetical protein
VRIHVSDRITARRWWRLAWFGWIAPEEMALLPPPLYSGTWVKERDGVRYTRRIKGRVFVVNPFSRLALVLVWAPPLLYAEEKTA